MRRNVNDALDDLAGVTGAVYGELVSARRERERERWDEPGFAACRRPLHRLPAANVWRMPALAVPFTKKIPDEFWTAVALGMASVACPCGEAPELMVGVPMVCACDRAFLFSGQSVRVAVFETDPDYIEEGV